MLCRVPVVDSLAHAAVGTEAQLARALRQPRLDGHGLAGARAAPVQKAHLAVYGLVAHREAHGLLDDIPVRSGALCSIGDGGAECRESPAASGKNLLYWK